MGIDIANSIKSDEITIIIPVYNTSKYLVRCLNSVSKIDFPINVLLIDDGSTDDSAYICDQYVLKDMRYRVIHKKNEGLVATRKTGIENVQTRFFTFVDSDDYVESMEYTSLLENVFYTENNLSDIICVGMTEEYLNSKKKVINKFPNGIYYGEKLDELKKEMLSKGAFFEFGILPNLVCKIINTEFAKKNPVAINSDITIGEDTDMSFQFLLKTQKISILNDSPYHYCRRDDSMMWKRISIESIENLEKDLKFAFQQSEKKYNLLHQLEDYMDYIYLLCAPQKILSENSFFICSKENIALYGAGGVGKAIKNTMNVNITLWVDKNYSLYGDEVFPIEKLIERMNDYDKVFIANSNIEVCKLIKQSLVDMGITKPIYYYRCNE